MKFNTIAAISLIASLLAFSSASEAKAKKSTEGKAKAGQYFAKKSKDKKVKRDVASEKKKKKAKKKKSKKHKTH